MKRKIYAIISLFKSRSKRGIFNFINYILDSFLMLPFSSYHSHIKLCIVKLDVIGDYFIWSYSLPAIVESYRISDNDKILLIAEKSWANLALQTGYFDEVIAVDRAKFRMNVFYRIKILINLKKYKFEYVVKPTYTREFSLDESIVRFVKSEKKIGFLPDSEETESMFWKSISKRWFSQRINFPKVNASEFKKNIFFLYKIGAIDKLPSLGKYPFTFKYVSKNNYFIIFPGASVGKKKWGEISYAELINRIFGETELNCLICGGNDDVRSAELIINNIDLKYINRIENFTGKTSILDLLSVIKQAEILIGNDTSGIHIAAAVGTKSICILGGGHFGRFLPYPLDLEPKEFQPYIVYEEMPCYGCNWKCQYSISYNRPVPCISNISVDKVYKAFKEHYLKQFKY